MTPLEHAVNHLCLATAGMLLVGLGWATLCLLQYLGGW